MKGFVLVPPEGARVIDTGAARWWSEGAYLCNQSYVDGRVTVEHLRAGFEAARELSGGARVPLIAEAGPMTGATRDARDALAGPEAAARFRAMAVIVGSPVTRTLMNLFVRLSSPPFPVRMFSDPTEARAWASEQARSG